MPHPLDGVRAKIDRTVDHINALNPETLAYLNSKPYTVLREFHDEPSRFVFVVHEVKPAPPRLGVVLGDLIHDLRSALDHLVWQLACLTTSEPSDRLQFPIHLEPPSDWAAIAGDRLKDVPADAITEIEELQPHHRGDRDKAQATALAVVYTLNNEDKHRVILKTETALQDPERGLQVTFPSRDVRKIDPIEIHWGKTLESGTRLATVRFEQVGPDPDVQMKGYIPTDVAFGKIGFKVDALPGLSGEIYRKVRRFKRFFPAEDWPFAD